MLHRTLSLIFLTALLILTGCNPELTNPEQTPGNGFSVRPQGTRDFTTFNDFVTSVYQAPDSAKQTLVDSFLVWANNQTGIPYKEDSTAYFLYTHDQSVDVAVAGDFNGWSPSNSSFSHLYQTNLYYRAEHFEMDARLDYKLVIDGNNWILDPRNPHHVSGGYGPNSELAMPAYVQPPEIQEYEIPHGTLESFLWTDTTQGRSRNVKVYLPPDYAGNVDSFRTIYFHDGSEYLDLGFAENVLNYLIYQEAIPPVIGVFVNPTNRMTEYAYDYDFMAMFVNELVPYIDGSYRTLTRAEDRAIAGVSLGGLTSLLFSISHPDIFGNCGAYSPAIWGEYGDVIDLYHQAENVLPLKIYIDGGTYEPSIHAPAEQLAQYLMENGWDTVWHSWHEGHSWGAWRAHLDECLTYFWSLETTAIDEH